MGDSSNASKATFIVFNTSRQMNGSKRQLTPTRRAPALAILTAHSPTPTPDSSPTGPMHIVAATGIPYSSATSMAHSISKMLRKYSQMISSTLFRMSTSRAFLNSLWTLDLTEEPRLKVPVWVIPPATMVPLSRATFFGSVACCLVDFCTRKLAAFGKGIIMSPEGERLGDISASSCKLNSELLNCLWVFCSSFWCPGSSCGVATLLQGHDVRPISQNHLPTCQTANQALGVCHAFYDVSASRRVCYLNRGGKAPRKQHGPSRASHLPLP